MSSATAINAQTLLGLSPGTGANNLLKLGSNGEITLASGGTSTLGNVSLGTVSTGTWQGDVIADQYLTKTGNWTGTFAGQNASYYLDAGNLTNFSTPFDAAFGLKTTTNLSEGSNLYFTTARANTAFDTRLATKNTDALVEGTTNLYFSSTRAINALTGQNISIFNNDAGYITSASIPSVPVQSVFGRTGAVVATSGDYNTSQVTESGNLYYTQGRFDAAFGLKTTDNLTQGGINKYYSTSLFNTDLATKTTDNLTEGTTNKYFTNTIFDTAFGLKTTTDLSEGTNLYFTNSRAQSALAGLYEVPLTFSGPLTRTVNTISLAQATGSVPGFLSAADFASFDAKQSALVSGTNIKTINSNSLLGSGDISVAALIGYTPYNATNPSGYISNLSLFTTTNLTEGTNLYYTDARVIAAPLIGYTSGAGTVSAADTVLSAIQKINGNVDALVTGVSSVNGSTGAVTLTNLSAADTTLTFSGSYNGSTARTIGLNLGSTNTWTGAQTFNTSAATFAVAPNFSTMTSGSVLFAGASGALTQDNANFFWDNTNKRLGIATASPGASLHVNGSVILQTGSGTQVSARGLNANYFSAGQTLSLYAGTAGDVVLGPGSDVVTVKSTGNVGIGTTAPVSKLSVTNATSARGVFIDTNTVAAHSGVWLGANTLTPSVSNYNLLSNGTDTFINRPSGGQINFRENNTNQMTIASGGNVGIGTASPTQRLDIQGNSVIGRVPSAGSSAFSILYQDGGSTNYIGFQQRGTTASSGAGMGAIVGLSEVVSYNTGGMGVYTVNSAPLLLGTSNTERMRIDNAGRVGIGTTAPSRELHINVPVTNANRGILVTDHNDAAKSVLITSSNGATARPYIGTNGNNRIDFGVNALRSMTIDTNNSVGIGTTAPFTGLTSMPTGLDIGIYNTVGSEGNLMVRGYASLGGTSRGAYGGVGSNYYLDTANTIRRRFADSVSILDFPAGGFRFLTSGSGAVGSAITTTELMRVNSNGNVGFGTATPLGQFNIARATGDLEVRIGATTGGTRLYVGQEGLKSYAEMYFGNDWLIGGWPVNDFRISRLSNNYFNINSTTGNIGVGTITDAGFKLDVVGTFRSSGTATIGGNINLTGGSKINFGTGGGFIEGADTYLRFATNAGTERMRINNAGNIGIGTTSPVATLHVSDTTGAGIYVERVATPSTTSGGAVTILNNGSAPISGQRLGALHMGDTTLGAGGSASIQGFADGTFSAGVIPGSLRFYTTGASGTTLNERMRIDSAGNVGIGLSTPTNRLSVVGIVGDTTVMNISTTGGNTCSFSTTAGTWSCASDRNLKKDITALTATDTLTKLRLLAPVTFKYNWQQDTESPIPGFIAQEFETVFPELVRIDATTGYKSLSYAPLMPYAIKAIQELDIQMRAFAPDALDATASAKIKAFLTDIANNVINIKDLFAETVHVEKGLEIKDQATGTIYCVVIQNGDWVKTPGACDAPIVAPQENPVVSPTPDPVPEIAPTLEPAPTPDPVPVIDTPPTE